MKGVVGDEPAPNERPESVEGFARIASPDGLVERSEECRAAASQFTEQLLFAFAERAFGGNCRWLWGQQGRQLVGQV